jgi:DNA repair protein RadC
MRATKSIKKIKTDLNTEFNAQTDKLISMALHCLEERLTYKAGKQLNNSREVCAYLRLQLAEEKNEVFSVLFLDRKHRLLAFEKMFVGTINEATVYPRGVIQQALKYNASAIIAAHNHPSNNPTPSDADKKVTDDLKKILEIMSIELVTTSSLHVKKPFRLQNMD